MTTKRMCEGKTNTKHKRSNTRLTQTKRAQSPVGRIPDDSRNEQVAWIVRRVGTKEKNGWWLSTRDRKKGGDRTRRDPSVFVEQKHLLRSHPPRTGPLIDRSQTPYYHAKLQRVTLNK